MTDLTPVFAGIINLCVALATAFLIPWLKANYDPIDIVLRLASKTSVVLLNGSGFAGPNWSVRASLANLTTDDYMAIGKALHSILEGYHEEYLASKS